MIIQVSNDLYKVYSHNIMNSSLVFLDINKTGKEIAL